MIYPFHFFNLKYLIQFFFNQFIKEKWKKKQNSFLKNYPQKLKMIKKLNEKLIKYSDFSDKFPKFLEEINQRIKQLPLKEKLKTIALSNLYQERQKLDEKLENKIRKLTLKYEKSSMRFFEQVEENNI